MTGLACGDGGMERPRRGVRAPLCRPPGTGARRRGTGAGLDIVDSTWVFGCIYIFGSVCVCVSLCVWREREKGE